MNYRNWNHGEKQNGFKVKDSRIFATCLIAVMGVCVLFCYSPLTHAVEDAKVTKKMEKAETLFQKGEIDNALSLLEELAQKFPDDVRPTIRLARYYLDSKLYQDAILYAEQAYTKNNADDKAKSVLCEAFQGIGQMNIQLRKFEQAEEAYHKMVELCPTDDNKKRLSFLYAQLARDAVQRKELPAAITAYEKILELEPDNQQLYFELYRIYVRNDQKDKALEILQKGVLAFPEDMKLGLALGSVYFQEQKFDEARDFFGKALENDPDNFHVANFYAQVLWRLADKKFEQLKNDDLLPKVTKKPGSTKASIAEYNKEVEKVQAEMLALKREIYQPVVDAFNRAIALDKDQKDPKLLMNSAIIHNFLGNEQDMKQAYLAAAQIYQQRLEADAGDLDAMHYCAWCQFNANEQLSDAENLFKKLLSLDEQHTHPTALIYLGEILIDQKRYDEAQQHLKTFLADYSDHPSRNRAELLLDYIDAVLKGTDAGKKPTKLLLKEPVLDFGSDDETGLKLDDDSIGLSEEELLGN
ncbi:tetratricopeptide repeat protein [bacterium]|nr:tetratricopeptide repeat protein [bacterium]